MIIGQETYRWFLKKQLATKGQTSKSIAKNNKVSLLPMTMNSQPNLKPQGKG